MPAEHCWLYNATFTKEFKAFLSNLIFIIARAERESRYRSMRVPFHFIFTLSYGQIVPKNHIIIGKFTVAAGVPLSPTIKVFGAEIRRLTNCDLALEHEEGIFEITGFYPSDGQPSSSQ